MGNFQPVLSFALQAEGGYQCAPSDSGNWTGGLCQAGDLVGTCMGISAPALLAWLGPERAASLTAAMMRNLDPGIAQAIYGSDYWIPVRGPELPAGIDLMVFDAAVMSGVRRSVRLLQAALAVVTDGYFGPQTMAGVQALPGDALIDLLALQHERWLRQAPGAATYLDGWLARLQQRQATAHNLLRDAST